MTDTMDDLVRQEISNLLATGEKLAADASGARASLGYDRVQQLVSITARGGQLIARLYGPDSHYSQMFKTITETPKYHVMHSGYHGHVDSLVGILQAVEHDINTGMLENFRSLVQAEIFADFLEMAEHLLQEGYKDAAAVLLGAILEDSLRRIAEGNNIAFLNSKGRPLTIDPLNAALAKKGVYNALIQKQVTSWADLRNKAAHGEFSAYDTGQVQQMSSFVQKFCADYLR